MGNTIQDNTGAGGTSLGAVVVPGAIPVKFKPAGTGVMGASYAAAATLLKNIGHIVDPTIAPTTHFGLYASGFDGTDNDGDGLVDELDEGLTAPGTTTADPGALLTVQRALANHRHVTARSEMLYAILVEGRGPLGSVFNSDEFTPAEVRDTDNDGLPEFIDGWGNPLLFYRWPTHYISDVQDGAINRRGFDGIDNNGDGVIDDLAEASNYIDPVNASLSRSIYREQNPVDPGGLLVAPSWWAGSLGASSFPSGNATAFQQNFFSTIEPLAPPGMAPPMPGLWDRNGFYARRAFMFKPLVISAGPDGLPGVEVFADFAATGLTVDAYSERLIQMECQAAPYASAFRQPNAPNLFQNPTGAFVANAFTLGQQGADDITNHNLNSPSGGSNR
jgi:hypothetical protein